MSTDLILYALMALMAVSIFIDFKGHKGHEMSVKEATLWSVFWIAISCVFGAFVWLTYGAAFGQQFFAGYMLEKVLSVDNLMVFVAIFASFGIKCQQTQHKILLWGIAGAIFFRGLFTYFGTELMSLHYSVQVLFGLIVLYTAYMMYSQNDEEEEVDYTKHGAIRFLSKFIPVSKELDGENFFTRINGKLFVTPVMACLMVVELSDILFAFDSVPAVIAVTQEPALVFSAMMLAIMGLRALYFVLVAMMDKIPNLDTSVIMILIFIGLKLVFAAFGIHVDPVVSLSIIGGLLTIGFFGGKTTK